MFPHHDTMADPGGFAETLQISKVDAVRILIGEYELPHRIPKRRGIQRLHSSSHEEDEEQPEPLSPPSLH